MIPHLDRLGGNEVADAIRRGATVCAATQRLSHALVEAWNGLMREEGRTIWRTPDILPLGVWQRRVTATCRVRRNGTDGTALRILEEQQELLTWEQAAIAAGVMGDVLQPLQLARAMMDAHALASAWDIRFTEKDTAPGMDADAFLAVREQAEIRWRQLDAAPAARLPWSVVEAARIAPELLPKEIMFVGFDLPADAALRETFHALRDAGVRVTSPASPYAPALAGMLRFPSFEDELHAAAAWCRDLLEQGEGEIGVIIPHLDSVRTLTDHVFSRVLRRVSARLDSREADALFELSLGPRAAEEPLIHAAFLLLDILRGSLDLEQWTRILHTPFLRGAHAYGDQRALLDAELRRRGMRQASATDIRFMASTSDRFAGDPFIDALAQVAPDGTRRAASEWGGVFLQFLDAFGWPGERTLRSREYQARERFRELLQEFSALDAVMAPVPLIEALGRFRLLAGERVFQTRNVSAPVQIMGVRESVGLRFAHCRVLGMNDDIWPPTPRPTAFIPVHLQKQAGVPAAVPERFLAQVRDETALLLRTAREVTFTCSRSEGDRELLPTPLLASLEVEDRPPVRRDAVSLLAGSERHALVSITDVVGPAVDQDEKIRGGTSVIALQSACPFRAFAELRLHAAQPDSIEFGLRALDRGNLVHAAMERFWLRVENQARLLALSAADLQAMLRQIVDETLRQEAALSVRRIAEHLVEAERECLTLILSDWIDLERGRLPFAVDGCEVRSELNIEGLHLRVRADRIDRLTDGGTMIIDYKTGKKSVTDWMSDRPSEPQIPLYVQAMDDNLRAAAFAVLRRGDCHFSGLRDEGAAGDECSSASEYLQKRDMEERSWTDLRGRWSRILHGLARDFMAGSAGVDPRDGADTCEWCALSALCRVDSAGGSDAEDDRTHSQSTEGEEAYA